MVLGGRLELPRISPLAPQASASAIPPPEQTFQIYIIDETGSNLHENPDLSKQTPEFFFGLFSSSSGSKRIFTAADAHVHHREEPFQHGIPLPQTPGIDFSALYEVPAG